MYKKQATIQSSNLLTFKWPIKQQPFAYDTHVNVNTTQAKQL